MKKIVLSLIFSSGIVFLTHAQEGISPEEQAMSPPEESFSPEAEEAEGKIQIETTNIPPVVLRAFASSNYQEMTIVEAYTLRGGALDEMPGLVQVPKPEMLYELLVEDSTRSALLYFTEDGELYDTIENV